MTFASDKPNEYFPNVGRTVVGVVKHGREAYLMATKEGKVQVGREKGMGRGGDKSTNT